MIYKAVDLQEMLSHGFCSAYRPQEKEVVLRQIMAEFVFGKQARYL